MANLKRKGPEWTNVFSPITNVELKKVLMPVMSNVIKISQN